MTTIGSIYAAGWTMTVTNEKTNETRIKIRTARGETPSVAVPTADLLAALGAVPKEPEQPPLADRERDLLGPQNDDGQYWHGRAMANLRKAELATTRAEKAEAERDTLAATVERVKALASEWLLMGRITREKGSQLSAALTPPKPAFELPTEPGVRFKATDNCSKPCVFLSVWNGPDIAFVNERTSVIWDGENVLKYCTDHRLLDGAE